MLALNGGPPPRNTCRSITSNEMKLNYKLENPMTSLTVGFDNGSILEPNVYYIYDKTCNRGNLRYFLLDRQDQTRLKKILRRCRDANKRHEKGEDLLSCLAKFTKNYKKTFYVRMFPPSKRDNFGYGEANRVFTEEILEILPMILKQQGCPLEEGDDRYRFYETLWKKESPWSFNTVDTETFEKVLDEFQVDRTFVVLVADPVCALNGSLKFYHDGSLLVFAPNLQLVFNLHEAINCVFTNLVMQVNWKTEKCKQHEDCIQNLKAKIIDLMIVLQNAPEEALIYSTSTIDGINAVRKCCLFNFKTKCLLTDLNIPKEKADETVPVAHYHAFAKQYDLPVYKNYIDGSNKECLPVWMYRLFLKLGWIQLFLPEGEYHTIRHIMVENLIFSVPLPTRAAGKWFIDCILRGYDEEPVCMLLDQQPDERNVEEAADPTNDDEVLAALADEQLSIQTRTKKASKNKKIKRNKRR